MKNTLAENMLRFGAKNLDAKATTKLKKLAEQTNMDSRVRSIGQLKSQLTKYQTVPLPSDSQYTAYKSVRSGTDKFYKVFVTDDSIISDINMAGKKFVIGKSGTVSYENESKLKFVLDVEPLIGIVVVNDNVSSTGELAMDISIEISTKNMQPFVVNPTSPALNNLITSLFILGKPDPRFTFKAVSAYNEAKHKEALVGVINCITKGNELGLFNVTVPTVDMLKLL